MGGRDGWYMRGVALISLSSRLHLPSFPCHGEHISGSREMLKAGGSIDGKDVTVEIDVVYPTNTFSTPSLVKEMKAM